MRVIQLHYINWNGSQKTHTDTEIVSYNTSCSLSVCVDGRQCAFMVIKVSQKETGSFQVMI